MVRVAVAVLATLALSGCTSSAGSTAHPPATAAVPGATAGIPGATAAVPGATAAVPGATRTSPGWTVTVYYTAVEAFHHGPAQRVTGCPNIDCRHGSTDLGTYPADFVTAVKDEGAGRTAAGRYLNWSYDTGYWLDTAARDTAGRALRPFESAAADSDVLRSGTRFAIVQCGRAEGGGAVDTQVCGRLRTAQWTITDEFTPGLGGKKHVDVYLGEETGPGFTDGPWYTTLVGAMLGVT